MQGPSYSVQMAWFYTPILLHPDLQILSFPYLDSLIQQGAMIISTLLRTYSIGSISNFRHSQVPSIIQLTMAQVHNGFPVKRWDQVSSLMQMLELFTLPFPSISHNLAHPWSYARALFYNSFCTPVHGLFVTLRSVRRCPFQDLWFPLASLSSCFFPNFLN